MTKLSLIIWASLCLLTSACSTQDPKPPTPPPTAPVVQCDLTLCYLPARPPIRTNNDWPAALTNTEAALLSCAVQVQECIEVQAAQAQKSPH